MDLFLEPTNENKDKLIGALKEYHIEDESISRLTKLDFTKIQFFFVGEKPRRIDFLTKISGITYEQAAKEVNYFPMKNEMVPIIQYHHLILSKIANERAKDKADVEELQKINKMKRDEK